MRQRQVIRNKLQARRVSAAAGEEVNGDVGESEQAAECASHPFQSLNGSFVRVHATLQLRQAARLSIADHLFHLALQNRQVRENLPFEICHLLLLWLQ
jgi:hypothetical protein